MKMNPVVHFEMPAEDRKRMIEFYSKVFGWKAEQLGTEMGNYVVVSTTERYPKTKFPKEPGRINGGFFQKTKDNQYPSVVIAVDDIREHMKKVKEAGGKVEFPAGTTHKARGNSDDGRMIIGVRKTLITFKSKHISVSINRSARDVYEFASNPESLPKWATGLSGSIEKANGEWIAESPMGKIRIKFAEKNKFGILDHDVILQSGEEIYNPMRVFPNNDGSELIFTLYHRPGMSEQMFADDAKLVKKDLERLKELLER